MNRSNKQLVLSGSLMTRQDDRVTPLTPLTCENMCEEFDTIKGQYGENGREMEYIRARLFIAEVVSRYPVDQLRRFAFHLLTSDVDAYIYLVSQAPCLLHIKDAQNWTALHWASHFLPSQIRTLVEMGAKMNECSTVGNTPLDLVYKFGSLESVICLLKEGASTMIGHRVWLLKKDKENIWKKCRDARHLLRCHYLSLLRPLKGLYEIHKRLIIEMLV